MQTGRERVRERCDEQRDTTVTTKVAAGRTAQDTSFVATKQGGRIFPVRVAPSSCAPWPLARHTTRTHDKPTGVSLGVSNRATTADHRSVSRSHLKPYTPGTSWAPAEGSPTNATRTALEQSDWVYRLGRRALFMHRVRNCLLSPRGNRMEYSRYAANSVARPLFLAGRPVRLGVTGAIRGSSPGHAPKHSPHTPPATWRGGRYHLGLEAHRTTSASESIKSGKSRVGRPRQFSSKHVLISLAAGVHLGGEPEGAIGGLRRTSSLTRMKKRGCREATAEIDPRGLVSKQLRRPPVDCSGVLVLRLLASRPPPCAGTKNKSEPADVLR
jgi:hypothetical protein